MKWRLRRAFHRLPYIVHGLCLKPRQRLRHLDPTKRDTLPDPLLSPSIPLFYFGNQVQACGATFLENTHCNENFILFYQYLPKSFCVPDFKIPFFPDFVFSGFGLPDYEASPIHKITFSKKKHLMQNNQCITSHHQICRKWKIFNLSILIHIFS